MRYFEDMKIVTKLTTVFAALIVVSMVVSAVTWFNISVAEENQAWSAHSAEVMGGADIVMASMIDQETGLRGYLVTSDTAFLAPYLQGRRDFAAGLDRVRSLTVDNPMQQRRIAELELTARSWQQDFAVKEIEMAAKPGGIDAARKFAALGGGKSKMDTLRATVTEIRGAEAALLAVRNASTASAFYSTKTATVLGMAGSVVLAAILAGALARSICGAIGALTMAMTRLADGEGAVTVPGIGRSDEIGRLARAFNHMLAELAVEVSERKQAEAATRQLNAELEDRVRQRTADLAVANQELSAFAYSVSHDLRAPLRAIDGFGGKLEKSYADRLDGEGRRLLQVVRDSARRMGRLIDDLLAFSRMGRREMAVNPVDMTNLVRTVANELRASEPAGRAIEIDIAELPAATGDPAMLRQVWVNLLSNAIKFTRTREPAHIEVGAEREGGEIRYWVKDNGVGFDMQYADKLFGVFQRLHAVDEFEGTGVGLALSQRIVHRHGGHIAAQSAVDAGATFSFVLPAGPPPNDEEPTP